MFWVVFFSLSFSAIALFWDEVFIASTARLLGLDISSRFLLVWVVVSGVLATALITIHAPPHLRLVVSLLSTVLLLTFARGYIQGDGITI